MSTGTPVQGMPVYENTPAPQQQPAAQIEVSVQRLQMPISWVASLMATVVVGALSVGTVFYRVEAHATDDAKHLGPEVARQGGVVTSQRLRRVLRKMLITCQPVTAAGFACSVTLPEEAE